jgi:hypothetical protein
MSRQKQEIAKITGQTEREREREGGGCFTSTTLSFSEIIYVVASVVDERTKVTLHWWTDTDRGKRKC